ncbi:MAG: hypothetical protein RR348_00060 [Clostridia bacterium]
MKEEEIALDGGQLIIDLVKDGFQPNAPRLAGSNGEKTCAEQIKKQMTTNLGNAVSQSFSYAHNSSYNNISSIGGASAMAFGLYYLSPIISLVMACCIIVFFFIQICFHTGWLDFLFKKKQSTNVFSTVAPNGDKGNLTIMFAGNLDSFYKCNNSKNNEKINLAKFFLGLISILFLAMFSIMAISHGIIWYTYLQEFARTQVFGSSEIYTIVLYSLPTLCLPGFFWIANYVDFNEKNAPSDCVNGLIGAEFGIAVSQYFLQNPSECPPDCNIMTVGFGAETIGQKGSQAFCRQNPDILNSNLYVINLGGFGASEILDIKTFDLFSRTVFDSDLIDIAEQTLDELGLDYNFSQNIVNCSPTVPFTIRNVKTLAINPQVFFTTQQQQDANLLSNISASTAGKYFIFLLKMIPKIAEYNNNKTTTNNKDNQ